MKTERVVVFDNSGTIDRKIILKRKKYIILVCLLLILQSGLRNVAVGADTYAYYDAFERVKLMSWTQIFDTFIQVYEFGVGKDPGYLFFQKIIQIVVNDYQIYLIVIAVLFFSALGNFIYKNTYRIIDVMFAFILYSTLFYAFFSITGHRQTIATAVALYGYELIKRKKLLPFIILILLASTIHRSVLIFIPLYFIRSQKAIKYLLISFTVLLPLMFYYSDVISLFFQSMDYTYSAYEQMENLRPYNYVVLNLTIFLLGVFTYKDSFKQKSNDTQFWYAALLLATLFTTQVFHIHGFMRVIYYFSIFNLLLIPHMFQIISKKTRIINSQLVALGIVLMLLLYIGSSSESEYKFFWQVMELGINYR